MVKAVKRTITKYYKYQTPAIGYRQLTYLESSGTQYIDTGIKPTVNTKVITTLKTTSDISGTQAIFASQDSGNSKAFKAYIVSGWRFGDTSITSPTLSASTEYTIQMSKDGVVVNDTTYSFGSYSFSGTSAYNLYLFCNNASGTITQYSKIIMKEFEIFESDTLIRNLIPVERLSDNVLGLYDTVSSTFFTNLGSGVFTGGEYIVIEGTKDDYDYYEDVEVFELPTKQTRTYYKYVYNTWTQPTFTSATTWGNVSADNYYVDEPPYHAVNGLTSGGNEADYATGGVSSSNWYWSFEAPLRISHIKIWTRNGTATYAGDTTYTYYGLNADLITYTELGTITISSSSSGWDIGETDISPQTYYGLKIHLVGTQNNPGIGELLLTADEQSTTEGTATDYDYYIDTITGYYGINQ